MNNEFLDISTSKKIKRPGVGERLITGRRTYELLGLLFKYSTFLTDYIIKQVDKKAKEGSLVSWFSHTIWARLNELNFFRVRGRNIFDSTIGNGAEISIWKSGIK